MRDGPCRFLNCGAAQHPNTLSINGGTSEAFRPHSHSQLVTRTGARSKVSSSSDPSFVGHVPPRSLLLVRDGSAMLAQPPGETRPKVGWLPPHAKPGAQTRPEAFVAERCHLQVPPLPRAWLGLPTCTCRKNVISNSTCPPTITQLKWQARAPFKSMADFFLQAPINSAIGPFITLPSVYTSTISDI